VALQTSATKPPERYDIPLPGLIFLCRPGREPWVFAATSRPSGPKERVFEAPLANVYSNGRTCPGNNKYPSDIAGIPDSFFRSFFTHGANLDHRSKRQPDDITKLWKALDKKKEYPLSDLVYHGTVNDLMQMRVN
jgi:PRTRC genetic system protein B